MAYLISLSKRLPLKWFQPCCHGGRRLYITNGQLPIAHFQQAVTVQLMPHNILHVTPYMHASAGGPPVVVENFIAEARRLGHSSEIVSPFAFCNGDESILRTHLEQLAPTTFLTGLETVPIV